MERTRMNCEGMEAELANLLLDAEAAPARVHAHVAECERCRGELAELRATMSLLDADVAPEPSPYFLSKLDARMREEREAAPAGWLERLRARFAYGPRPHARPLAAMALTIFLLLGGAGYLGVTSLEKPVQPAGPEAAVVHDLQLMDSNAQLLDQLESLSASGENGD